MLVLLLVPQGSVLTIPMLVEYEFAVLAKPARIVIHGGLGISKRFKQWVDLYRR